MELYFYTDLETDFHRKRVKALLDGKLILSDPSRFNDPFDSKLNFAYEDLEGLDEKLRSRNEGSVCGHLSSSERPGLRRTPKNICSQYRMFCFSARWDVCLMWSHYALKHKGICLKFKITPSALPHALDALAAVRYSTHYPQLSGEKIEAAEKESMETFFLTKSVDWLYENEWRYITRYNDCEHNADLKAEYVDCGDWLEVEEVFFGSEFNDLKMYSEIERYLSETPYLKSGRLNDTEARDEYYQSLRDERDKIFGWMERNDEASLKLFFKDHWDHKNDPIKGLVRRGQVLMSLKNRGLELRKCKKMKDKFGLELSEFQYEPLQSSYSSL